MNDRKCIGTAHELKIKTLCTLAINYIVVVVVVELVIVIEPLNFIVCDFS